MRDLMLAIVWQAIEDYRYLKEHELEFMSEYGVGASKCEIEHFFKSEWCDYLLDSIHITGKDILRMLKE